MENFKCKLCGKSFSVNYSGKHLSSVHNISAKQYYDLHFKNTKDDLCKICGSETKFKTIKRGYSNCCSVICSNKYRNKILYNEHGVNNLFQLDYIKDKIKKTNFKKYGVENVSNSEIIKEKKKKTLLRNYGVEFGLQNKEIIKKQNKTMFEKYGVTNAMHNYDFVKKAILSGAGRAIPKKYKTIFGDTIITQGKLESKFVTLCEEKNIRILDGPCIEYLWENNPSKYFVDFQIMYKNNIWLIEIKSSYWFYKYKERTLAKKIAAEKWCKENNYLGYFLIIDKIELPVNVRDKQ